MLERDGAANVTRYTAYTMYTAKPHQPPFARETFAVDKLLYECVKIEQVETIDTTANDYA